MPAATRSSRRISFRIRSAVGKPCCDFRCSLSGFRHRSVNKARSLRSSRENRIGSMWLPRWASILYISVFSLGVTTDCSESRFSFPLVRLAPSTTSCNFLHLTTACFGRLTTSLSHYTLCSAERKWNGWCNNTWEGCRTWRVKLQIVKCIGVKKGHYMEKVDNKVYIERAFKNSKKKWNQTVNTKYNIKTCNAWTKWQVDHKPKKRGLLHIVTKL